MTTATTTGTTLEILAPYLPYGIEVETIGGGIFSGEHQILRGLDFGAEFPILLGTSPEKDEDSSDIACQPHACLPILRPFSALVTPLEDGTVPAVEVAKLALGWRLPDFPTIEKVEQTDRYVLVYSTPTLRVTIEPDWQVELVSNGNRWALGSGIYSIADYLRSKHFAVGLEPHQFIAKS